MNIQRNVVIRHRRERRYEIRYYRGAGLVLILIPPQMWRAKRTRCRAWRSGRCVGDAADGGLCALHAWLDDIERRLERVGRDLAELARNESGNRQPAVRKGSRKAANPNR